MPKPASRFEFRETVFAYENEPVDERPSEFGTSTWVPVSGFCTTVAAVPRAPRRLEPRFGALAVLAAVIVVAGASTAALYWAAHFLKG